MERSKELETSKLRAQENGAELTWGSQSEKAGRSLGEMVVPEHEDSDVT